MEKNLNVRITLKHDTEENWLKATGFTPKLSEPIVYDEDGAHPYKRFKIGDGATNVNDLPFIEKKSGIIDVIELPIEGINDNALYRLTEAYFAENQWRNNYWECIVVNALGDVTNPIGVVDNPAAENPKITAYYDLETRTAYGYYSGTMIPLENIAPAFGLTYKGVTDDITTLPKDEDDSIGIVIEYNLYNYKNGKWNTIQQIGWRGTGNGAEVFNTPSNIASGIASHAEGYLTEATGNFAHAEGLGAKATGRAAHAEGTDTLAQGHVSHAEGTNSKAFGNESHAEGYETTANSHFTHAEGYQTLAGYDETYTYADDDKCRGQYAHAEGEGTKAINYSAHAEGKFTLAAGTASHAGGEGSEATGLRSFTHGWYTKAKETDQFVVGKFNADNKDALFVVGNGGDEGHRNNAFEVIHKKGNVSLVFDGTEITKADIEAIGEIKNIESNAKLIENLNFNSDIQSYIDSSNDNTKVVPLNVLPYAEILGLNGKVEKIEIYSGNRFADTDVVINDRPKSSLTIQDLGLGLYELNGFTGYQDSDFNYYTFASIPLTPGWYCFNTEIIDHGEEPDMFTYPQYQVEFNGETLSNEGTPFEIFEEGIVNIKISLITGHVGAQGSKIQMNLTPIIPWEIGAAPITKLEMTITSPEVGQFIPVKDNQVIAFIGSFDSSGDIKYYLKDISKCVSTINGQVGDVVLSAADVGAEAVGTARAAVEEHNAAIDAHTDIREAISAKLESTGGTITGDLVINGSLTVSGTTFAENHETLKVEDNLVVLNSNKINLQTSLSGIAINKNETDTYGAMYDPVNDTYKFGEGTVNEDGEFLFNEGEGLPFAIRDDSSKFTNGNTIVWSEEGCKLVDSGYPAFTQADWNQTNTKSPAFIRNKPNTLTSLEHAVGKRVSGIDSNNNTTYGEIFNDYDLNKISGAYAFACGTKTEAGTYAHATGYNVKATGTASSASGYNTVASGWASHVEGELCRAINSKAHAEGAECVAEGSCSHAEGLRAKAKQSASHAEGCDTYASGWYSHAEGQETIAGGNHSHAEGIRTVTFSEDGHAEGYETASVGPYSHAQGFGKVRAFLLTGAANVTTYSITAEDETYFELLLVGALVKYTDANGNITLAKIESLDLENKKITVSKTLSTAALDNAYSIIYVAGLAIGNQSHAEGYATIAMGASSHTEGYETYASMGYSHAEGQKTRATNWESHAQGKLTIASGIQSHAGGFGSESAGRRSFTHGYFAKAEQEDQFVVGRCNKASEKALFIVGNGSNSGTESAPQLNLSNAFEVISDVNGAAIKVGNTTITEAQLNQLLALLN